MMIMPPPIRLLLAAVALILCIHHTAYSLDIPPGGDMSVYFSPQGGASDAVVRAIDSAQREVYIQAFTFTSVPIAKAIVNAHKRGVHVEVVLDKSQTSEKYSSADFLARQGIPTYIDSAHSINHNKTVVTENTVCLGSMNLTKAGEVANAENELVVRNNAALVNAYKENFFLHRSHSALYRGNGSEAESAAPTLKEKGSNWLKSWLKPSF